jgi:hypothetical protein
MELEQLYEGWSDTVGLIDITIIVYIITLVIFLVISAIRHAIFPATNSDGKSLTIIEKTIKNIKFQKTQSYGTPDIFVGTIVWGPILITAIVVGATYYSSLPPRTNRN